MAAEAHLMGDAFGRLMWNDDLEWWSGSAEVADGCSIDLHLQAANDPADLRAAVAQAVPAWERLRAAEPAVRAAVASQMTTAHNDSCDPEDEVTEEEFANRLQLRSALFERSGSVELTYLDDGLFGGHCIIVPVGADGTVGAASEAG